MWSLCICQNILCNLAGQWKPEVDKGMGNELLFVYFCGKAIVCHSVGKWSEIKHRWTLSLFSCALMWTAQKTALIVYAHQSPASFNAAARDVAVEALTKQGYKVLVSDLYAMNFKASATADDIKGRNLLSCNILKYLRTVHLYFMCECKETISCVYCILKLGLSI